MTDGRIVPFPGATEIALHPVGMGYVYTDTAYGVTIAFKRLSRRSDPGAEVTVSVQLPALGQQELCTSQVNFLSGGKTGKKAQLAKELQERAPDIPWPAIVEGACSSVLRAIRRVEVMAPGPVNPTPQYRKDRLQYLIRESTLNVLYGPGGVGKGWLAMLAALCVQQGQPFCGLEVQQGEVLYLDWEDDFETFAVRVAVVANGNGLRPETVHYMRCRGALRHQVEEILEYIAAHHIALVILDSVSKAFPRGEFSSYEATADEMAEETALFPTTLAIDHVAGGSVGSEDLAGKPIGGIGKVNASRNQWEARSVQDPGTFAFHLALHQTKRNHTDRLRPLGFTLAFNHPERPTQVAIRCADLRDVPELEQEIPIAERVRKLLTSHKLTYTRMYQLLGVEGDKKAQSTVRTAVERGLRCREYCREGEGIGSSFWRPVKEREPHDMSRDTDDSSLYLGAMRHGLDI